MNVEELKEKLEVGESIYINKKLLNPKYDGYSTSYTFGSLKNKCGKSNIAKDDIDVIKIEKNNLEIYLKRLYG